MDGPAPSAAQRSAFPSGARPTAPAWHEMPAIYLREDEDGAP
jgi:hypothetical protein